MVDDNFICTGEPKR